MNIKMLKMAFAGLVLGVSSLANAGLIRTDFQASGDQLLVLDQSTNLEWALVTHTGKTINDFLNNSIYSNNGFQIATAQDLLAMWTNGGATNLVIGVGNNDAAN